MFSSRDEVSFRRLAQRFLTKGGVGIQAVTAAATTAAVVFDLEEPDALYGVLATPDWSTTVFYTARATTGFTLNFGTAAPGGGGNATWIVVRE